ncbi:unnamed protein product, partial [Meganyctiphanes norvegica]
MPPKRKQDEPEESSENSAPKKVKKEDFDSDAKTPERKTMAADANFVCLRCDKGFARKGTYTTHIRNVCGIKSAHPCPVCSKVFTCESYLKNHLRKSHIKPTANPCPHCSKVFSCERYLKDHIPRHHKPHYTPRLTYAAKLHRLKNESASLEYTQSCHIMKNESASLEYTQSCRICWQVFTREQDLNEHVIKVHEGKTGVISPTQKFDSINYIKNLFKCGEEGCENAYLPNMRSFRTHIKQLHGKDIQVSTHQFSSFEEFTYWKDATEAKIGIKYSKRGATRKSQNSQKSIYYCRRSGVFIPKGKGKKKFKRQGTCKIGCYCSSAIELVVTNGIYIVTYYEDHFGHTLNKQDLKHTLLPQSTKDFVADKLDQKVPTEHILKLIREDSTEYDRSFLITCQDIVNIEREFCLDNLQTLHPNDVESCRILAESMGSQVLYLKQQGVSDPEYPKLEDEYILIFMKKGQESVLQSHKDNKNLEILMDSTHGISKKGFQATTLMCITNLNEGFPLAICVSSNVKKNIIEIFLEKVKQKAGQSLNAFVFMSDDTTIFREAWWSIMGPESITHILICSWHTLRAWLKRIHQMKNVQKAEKKMIFQMLHILQKIVSMDEFNRKSELFLKYLKDKQYNGFLKYFQKNYLAEQRVKMWAFCHRKGVHLHTNNYLESMHKVLKYQFMKGKKVKRLDKCVIALSNLIDSRIYGRLHNLIFGVLDNNNIINLPVTATDDELNQEIDEFSDDELNQEIDEFSDDELNHEQLVGDVVQLLQEIKEEVESPNMPLNLLRTLKTQLTRSKALIN